MDQTSKSPTETKQNKHNTPCQTRKSNPVALAPQSDALPLGY